MVVGNGDRHEIRRTGLLTRLTCPRAGRAVETGCGAQIWGQTGCPIYRSGTFNVKRSTRNLQWGDRKGAWWPGYGDRHVIWTTGLLPRRSYPSAGRTVEAACGTQIWGQTRCPIYRSGTFNVQRSTLNLQRSDRKGVLWPGYGDRHEIWTTGLLIRWT